MAARGESTQPCPFRTPGELDAWWQAATPADRDALVCGCLFPDGDGPAWPTSDLAAAWKVGQAACARGRRTADRFATALLTGDTRPDCFMDTCESVVWLFAQEDTPALVCKAALLAVTDF